MALSYDPGSEQFVLRTPTILKRVDIELEPTLENALEALELLRALKASTERKLQAATARPDPLGVKKSAVDAAVDDYLARGGHITRSTYDPTAEAKASRLRPQLLAATSGSELLAALGLKGASNAD